MTTKRLIGDVHGRYKQYKRIIQDSPYPTIQVGDIGIGFKRTTGYRAGQFYENPPHYAMIRGDHRFIRGNHDNPDECKKHSQWIQDGTVEEGTLFVGGALSIDKVFRVEGLSWWSNEELSVIELNDMLNVYLFTKPRVMITHDCPEDVAVEIERAAHRGKLDPKFASRTRQALQSMWSAHSPELWVFGHWHYSFDHVLNGTRFVCLTELEFKDFEL